MKTNRFFLKFSSKRNQKAAATKASSLRKPSALAGSIFALAAVMLPIQKADAANLYWRTVGSGTWQTAGNWTTDSTGSTLVGSAVPVGTDVIFFNGSTINGVEVISLNAATAASGITFNNTGATTLQSDTTTSRVLTLGTTGMTIAATAGAVTIGSATNGTTITLGGAQTWTNNSTVSALTIVNALTLGANQLTIAGAGTTTINGTVGGTAAVGTVQITVGTGVASGSVLNLTSAANSFAGDIAVNGGTLVYSQGTATTTSQLGIGAGTSFKQILLSNNGAFRLSTLSFNDNIPSAAAKGAGVIFNIAASGGTFNVDSGLVLTLDDGTGAGTATTATQLQGSGTLTKTGLGVLSLGNSTASNAVFTGQILVNQGVLRTVSLTTGVGLGSTTANTVISSGAALDLSTSTSTAAEPVTISGTGAGASATYNANAGNGTNAIYATGTASSFAGAITLAADSTIGSGGTAGTMTLSGGITGTANLTINNLAGGGTTLSTVAVNNTGTITNSGAGTGATIISGGIGGNVTQINENSSTSALTVSGPVTVGATNKIFNSGGSSLFTLSGGTTGTGAVTFNANSAGNFTVSTASLNHIGTLTNSGSGSGTTTISSVIGANVTGVTQNSATSQLTISGTANTYTGPTTITQGTLSTGNVVVAAAASGLGNATSAVILGGASTKGTLQYTGGAATYTRNFTISAGGGDVNSTANTLTLLPGSTPTYAPIVLGTAPFGLGTGATASTTYITIGQTSMTGAMFTGTGTLTINGNGGAGIVLLSNSRGVVTAAAMPININSGQLKYAAALAGAVVTNVLGTGAITITPTAATTTLNLFTASVTGGASSTFGNPVILADAAGTVLITNGGGVSFTNTVTGPSGANTPTLRLNNTNGALYSLGFSGGFTGKMNLEIQPSGTNSPILLSGTAVNNTGSITNVGSTSSAISISTISAAVGSNVTGLTQNGLNAFTISGGVTANAAGLPITSSNTGLFTLSGAITGTSNLTIQANSTGNIVFGAAGTVNNIGTVTNSGTNSGSVTISNPIGANVTGVTQNSATSALTLSGNNASYAGTTTLSQGRLNINSANALGTGSFVVSGAGTASIDNTTAADIVLTPNNAITLNGDLTYVGTKNLDLGTGAVGLGAAAGTSRTVTVTANSLTIGGSISNGTTANSLTKAGNGTLVLSAANAYTGTTTVSAGALNVTGSLASGSALTVSGNSTFGLVSGAANALGNISTLTLGAASQTSVLGFDLGLNTAGSDRLVTPNAAVTAGTITLNINPIAGFGAATYNLISAASGLGGATYGLSAPGGFAYTLTSSASSVDLTAAASGSSGDLYWHGAVNSSWSGFGGVGLTSNWSAVPNGASDTNFAPSSLNTVNFSTTNAATGVITTTLDSSFAINDLKFLTPAGAVSAVNINPSFTLGATNTLTIAPTSSANGIALAQGVGAVTINAPVILGTAQTWSVDSTTPGVGTASSLTVGGAITGISTSGLTLAATAGTPTVTFIAATPDQNTYAGPTAIGAGVTLAAGATGSFPINSAVTVNGTLATGAFTNTVGALAGGSGIVQNGSATNAVLFINPASGTSTFSGTVQDGSTGTLGITKVNSGIQVLSGTNTYTGPTLVSGGTLRAGSTSAFGAGTGALTVTTPGILDLAGFNNTVGSIVVASTTGTITDSTTPLSGIGGILKVNTSIGGTATTALITGSVGIQYSNANASNAFSSNTNNTYSGGTYLGIGGTTGALTARFTPATGATGNGSGPSLTAGIMGTGAINIGRATTDAGQIYLSAATVTINNPVTYNSILGTDVVGGVRVDTTTGVFNGVQTAGLSAISYGGNAVGTLTVNGRLTGSGTFVGTTTSAGAGTLGFGQVITTPASLIVGVQLTAGPTTIVLNNTSGTANNYTGDTWITNKGVLQTNAANQLPSGVGTGDVYLNGVLNMQGNSQGIGALNGTGTLDGVSAGTPTLTIGANNGTGIFTGVIKNTAGTLSLVKSGSGTQTINGTANTFGGSVTANAGTLVMQGANTFTGAVNANSGGTVSFASSPATGGALGNSTVVNLNGGSIAFTVSGTNALNRSISIGAGDGTVNVQSSTGNLTTTPVASTGVGNLVKTGPGILTIAGVTTLAGGGGVNVSNGTLNAGFGAAGIATLAIGATGIMDMTNTTIEALTLGNAAGALTLANGANLTLELNGTTNDKVTLGATGTASTAGTVTINFTQFGSAIVTGTTYQLLSSASGGLNGATYALGSAPNGFNFTLSQTDNLVSVLATAFTPTYWNNTQGDGSWKNNTGNLGSIGAGAGTNWTNLTGGTDSGHTPLATETVIFSSNTGPSGTVNTTLDQSYTIDSLQFTSVPAAASTVNIAAGVGGAANTLTITPLSTSGGIRVLAGGGTGNIGTTPSEFKVVLGASQTWDIAPSQKLNINADVNFSGVSVNKSNGGEVTLAGNNTGAGTITLNGGTLNINSATALGSTSLIIKAGTTIDNTSAAGVTLTTVNAQTWDGDFTFAGTKDLTFGTGAITLTNSITLVTTAAGIALTEGGSVGQSGGTRALTKAGAGTLVLSGSTNTYAGLTTVNNGVLTLNAPNTTGGGLALNVGTLNIGNLSAVSGPLSIAAGTTLDNTGSAGTLVGVTSTAIAGSFTFTGTNSLNLGTGAVTLGATPTITTSNAATTLTIGGNIAATTNGLTMSGPGALTLAGINNYTGNTTVNGGTLNITGSILGNNTTSTLAYGTTAGNTIVNLSGTLNAFKMTGADTASAVTVFNQTAGTSTIVPTISADVQWVAQNGGYGALNITGGTFNTGRFDVVGNTVGGVGVVYVGGTGTFNNNVGDWIILPRANGTGEITVGPGGNLVRGAAVTNNIGITMSGTNSTGTLNIAGGTLDSGTKALEFGFGAPGLGNKGFVNLAGGTLKFGLAVNETGTTGSTAAYFNFAGGTLQANASLASFIPATSIAGHTITSTVFGPITNNNNANATFNTQIGLTSNFIGGLTVNTNGFTTTFANAFTGATGFGVTQANIGDVSLLAGNSGYIGAPAVTFSNPTAAGADPASGYAVIDAVSGKVTGIVVTNPGVYASAETPTITLSGGGGTIAAFATGALATANVSGGFTKIGAGSLILTATATANSFTGTTTITNGTLQLGAGGATGGISPSSTIVNNANLAFNRTNAMVQGTDFSTAGITGSGSLTLTGNGGLTLNANNTYLGATVINAGVLSLAHVTALGGNNPGVNGTSGITMASGTTLQANIVGITVSAPITTAASGTAKFNAPPTPGQAFGELILNGAIGGGANVTFNSITNTNTIQTITLGAASTYTGTTTLDNSAGISGQLFVKLGVDNALPTTTVLNILGQTGAGTGRGIGLNLFGFNQTLAGLTNTAFATRTQSVVNSDASAPATLTINGSTNTTYSGNLGSPANFSVSVLTIAGSNNGNNFGLTKNGSGTFTLSGAGNTYFGATTVQGGVLNLANSLAMQSSPLNTTGSIVGNATNGLRTTVTTLTMGGLTGNKNLADVFTTATGGPANATALGGYSGLTTLTLNPSSTSNTYTYTGGIADGATGMVLNKSGVGTQVLNGVVSTTGGINANAGVLALGNSGNSYTGTTAIGTAGSLLVTADGALGATGAGNETTITPLGQLGFSGGITYSTLEKVTGSGTGNGSPVGVFAVNQRGFIQSVSGSNTFAGDIVINAAGTSRIGTQDGAQLTLTGAITQASGNILFRAGNLAGDFVTLSNTGNSFGGDSTVFTGLATPGSYAGVRLGANNALPTNLTISSLGGTSDSAALDLAGFNQSLNGLIAGAANGVMSIINTNTGTPSTLTLNPTADKSSGTLVTNNTLIAGGGGLGDIVVEKVGSFNQTLFGLNTYSGVTNIKNGTLTATTVDATATNAQSLGANLTVNLGAAGASSGTLNYTGAAGTLAKNINALGNGNDTVKNSGSGALTLSGTLTKNGTTLTLNAATAAINVSGNIVGASANSDLIIAGPNTTTISSTGNTFNGPTTVNSTSTLAVTGSLSGTTAVTNSGTLLLNSTTNASNIIGTNGRTGNAGLQTAGGTNSAVNYTGATGSTLSVGNVVAGGVSNSFGTLTLSGNTFLDFASGNTNNNFFFNGLGGTTVADLIANAGNSLTINNWNAGSFVVASGVDSGNFGDNQSRLLFTSDPGFGAGIIAGINFTGFGAGAQQIQYGSSGLYEIVPVPEPATTALIGSVALCALIGYRERRRFTGMRRQVGKK